jgi:Peptidase propeptide and YPEB domain
MALRMRKRKTVLMVGAGALLAFLGAGAAVAAGVDDSERPITGGALQKATQAALAETGGGRVSETEVGDEESRYEVEVTLDDGSHVDVQLDENFAVVGTEGEAADEDEGQDEGDSE